MKKKSKTGFFLARILIILSGVIGTILIAIYPFDNRNIKITFVTPEERQTVSLSNDVIAAGQFGTFTFNDMEEFTLKKILVYGKWESILLKEFNFGEIAPYVSSVDGGTMNLAEDAIVFSGDGRISFTMTPSFIEVIKDLSATIIQERLILIGIAMAMTAMAIIFCNALQEKYIAENRDNHGPIYEIKRFCIDMRKYWQYIIFSARADLKAEVADSYLNRLWWLLEPFFNMLVYVIVFGQVMGRSVENYATFVFSALLMWNFFNKTIAYSVKLIRSNKDIVTKVYIPKFVILFSNMILNLLKLLFSMVVLIVMLAVFRIHIGVNLFWFFPAYLVMIMLAFGAGMIFLHFGVYVDDLSYAIGILLNMLMFLSGIFYDVMTTLPEPLNGLMLCLNPVAGLIDTMRQALLYNTAANLPILGMWFLISSILCYIGIHIVYKNENSYVKVV
ncbi:MAG: ABC transporter permease [Acetatifactor sp.]